MVYKKQTEILLKKETLQTVFILSNKATFSRKE